MSTAHYLREVLPLLIERGREAKFRMHEHSDVPFEAGRALGYYETISTLTNPLDTFGLVRERFGVDPDFDPDKELI